MIVDDSHWLGLPPRAPALNVTTLVTDNSLHGVTYQLISPLKLGCA